MSRKPNPPAAYRRNANGTVTITGFAKSVIISKAYAERGSIFEETKPGSGVWVGPVPSDCYSCRAPALFATKSVRRGEELLVITYKCANCGFSDDDYLD